MWIFNNKRKLAKSGILEGMTDWHSHILPGVDDGFEDMEESLEALARLEELGVKRLWLTPHVMEDFPNTPDKLRAVYSELKDAYDGSMDIRLASENMLDYLFEERLKKNEFLPIGEKGDMLLVETSYMNAPYCMDDMIEGIISKGYFPLLAHPERYRYMEEADYIKWRGRGVRFQINYISLLGGYGEIAKKKAEWLLKKGFVEATGSDLHRLEFLEQSLNKATDKNALESWFQLRNNPKIK